MARQAYTVSQLNAYIRVYLRSDEVLQDIWVSGEISNFYRHSSGHCYFTLKDKNSTLKAVLFKGQAGNVSFNLENGQEVLIRGSIDVYETRGEYQIYVYEVEPAGLGALYLAFEQLKEKLAKEGLFSEEFKKELPFFPRRLGVVTSPTGAVIKDITSILARRFKGLSIYIAPARVQGQGASKEIIAGIKDLEKIGVDVIIVARGGGSIEELWVFNDEELARVAFASPIPLISAIGHERDYTILDYVADVRAATPSEAAELVITPSYELQERINKYERRLESSLMGKVQNSRLELEHLLQRRVLKHPLEAQNVSRQKVDDLAQRLEFALRQKMNLSRENFKTWLAKLDGLSPLKVMSLGYSVCKDAQSGEILVSSENLKKGDLLEIMFAKGEARVKVEGLS